MMKDCCFGLTVAILGLTGFGFETDSLKPFPVARPVPEYLKDEHRVFQSAPSMTISRGGRLWCVWHTGLASEGPDNCIVVVSSGDGGKTWTKPLFSIDAEGPLRVLDPGLWTDPDGKVWLFYSQLYEFWDGRAGVWAMHPVDPECADTEWTPARRLCDGYLKNKPLVAKDGTWLLPVEFMHGKPFCWTMGLNKPQPMRGPEAHPMPERTTGANVYASADKGATVSYLGQAFIPKDDRDCPEHMLTERTDGSLRMLVRTKYGIGEAFSSDGGKTWSQVEPSKIRNPNSRFYVGRLASGALLLVKNGPVKERAPRERIMAFVSDDDGATWTGGLMLDERKSVSYPDAVQGADGFIHVVHDRERRKAREILHHVFTEADVRAGKLVSSGSRLKDIVNKALGKPLSASGRAAKEVAWPSDGYAVSDREVFVDNESKGRSGHMGHALVDCGNGRILDFCSNCAGEERFHGHSGYGWMEYRVSTDYGKTFGPPRVLEYTKRLYDEGKHTALCEKAIKAPNGRIYLFFQITDQSQPICCEPWSEPTLITSDDDGETFSEPVRACPDKGRIYDVAADDKFVYFLIAANPHFIGSKPQHAYKVYRSDGTGPFEPSVVSFGAQNHGYGALKFGPDGALHAYAYDIKDKGHLAHAISRDRAVTWEKPDLVAVKKGCRNPQMARVGDRWFLGGRCHTCPEQPEDGASYVLYTSTDGVNWDDGALIDTKPPKTGTGYYSHMLPVLEPGKAPRVLLQYSRAYKSSCVNVCHRWIAPEK